MQVSYVINAHIFICIYKVLVSKGLFSMDSFFNFDFPDLNNASIPEFVTQRVGESLPQFNDLVAMSTPRYGSYLHSSS